MQQIWENNWTPLCILITNGLTSSDGFGSKNFDLGRVNFLLLVGSATFSLGLENFQFCSLWIKKGCFGSGQKVPRLTSYLLWVKSMLGLGQVRAHLYNKDYYLYDLMSGLVYTAQDIIIAKSLCSIFNNGEFSNKSSFFEVALSNFLPVSREWSQ